MSKIELALLKPLDSGIITELSAEACLQQRLLALGFRVGRKITMLRKAPFNGPVHIRIGTTEVMLRRRDALFIHVMKISEKS
ncbi:MAG: ferrous iron transport protein A [Calothrix sp. C42_A2020_038]|nr:ferrous iron transport protein A [Calothrix sp. C42_A2020_038]